MSISIIGIRAVGTDDGHDYIDWVDCLITISHFKGYSLEVAVRIGELR